MRKVSFFTRSFLVITLIAGAFFFAPPLIAKTITLNYANFPPAPTFPCVQMERWKEEIEKRTDGKIRVNTFPGGTLLGAKGMLDGIIAGQADIGNLCMAYQPGRFMVSNSVSLPVGIETAKVGSRILLELYEKYQPEAFKDVVVLTMFTNSPGNIMSKIPVKSLADLKGLDLRASGGATEILKAWMANPVGMPMPATAEALQKGTVKGIFSSLEVMKDFKFAEICKYVTITNTGVYPFAVIMNKRSYASLTDDLKKVLMDLNKDQMMWTANYIDDVITSAINWSEKEHGVEVTHLTAEQKAEWDSKLVQITDKWISDANDKGLPAAQIISDIKNSIKAQ